MVEHSRESQADVYKEMMMIHPLWDLHALVKQRYHQWVFAQAFVAVCRYKGEPLLLVKDAERTRDAALAAWQDAHQKLVDYVPEGARSPRED